MSHLSKSVVMFLQGFVLDCSPLTVEPLDEVKGTLGAMACRAQEENLQKTAIYTVIS